MAKLNVRGYVVKMKAVKETPDHELYAKVEFAFRSDGTVLKKATFKRADGPNWSDGWKVASTRKHGQTADEIAEKFVTSLEAQGFTVTNVD